MSDWHTRLRQQKAGREMSRTEQGALATARADEQVRKLSAIRKHRVEREWQELCTAILVALRIR